MALELEDGPSGARAADSLAGDRFYGPEGAALEGLC